MTLTRDQLHHLIDNLPEAQLADVAAAVDRALDPVTRAILTAPLDDEPYTDEDRAAVAAADAAIARGDVVSHEEIKRELGL